MIRGMVTADRVAVVQLRIYGRKSEHDVEFTVDTGFNDFLTLPHRSIEALEVAFAAAPLAKLADGTVVEANSYPAAARWDDQRRDVLVIGFDSEALAGMSLLYGHDLHLEVVEGGLVTNERRQQEDGPPIAGFVAYVIPPTRPLPFPGRRQRPRLRNRHPPAAALDAVQTASLPRARGPDAAAESARAPARGRRRTAC